MDMHPQPPFQLHVHLPPATTAPHHHQLDQTYSTYSRATFPCQNLPDSDPRAVPSQPFCSLVKTSSVHLAHGQVPLPLQGHSSTNGLAGLLLAAFLGFILGLFARTNWQTRSSGYSRLLITKEYSTSQASFRITALFAEDIDTASWSDSNLLLVQQSPNIWQGIIGQTRVAIDHPIPSKLVMEIDTEHTEGRSGSTKMSSQSSRDDMPDTPMPDANGLISTPFQRLDEASAMPSSSSLASFPMTRSRTKLLASLEGPASHQSQALVRLQTATSIPQLSATGLSLEGSRDIANEASVSGVISNRVGSGSVDSVRKPARARPQNKKPRHSTRIESRDKSPLTAVKKNQKTPRISIRQKPSTSQTRFPRRSKRLAKPPVDFPRYPDLPRELKLLIWEQAVGPRVVYIRNQAAPFFTPETQTKRPDWFMTDTASVYVAKQNYSGMFGSRSLPGTAINGSRQPFNPEVDIVVLEPCCNGCRAYWCIRSQFPQEDKQAIQSLAVQIDSPLLIFAARPCWDTISMSFPNVKTLYLLRSALKGSHPTEKALIRIGEGQHETGLRRRFNEWKKTAGKTRAVVTLEFAVVVDMEPESVDRRNRYHSVPLRKTGTPDDIIVG